MSGGAEQPDAAEAATLPNLLVIGAMKCGTSSLHHYLGQHPEIAMSAPKEPNFLLPAEPEPPAKAGTLDRALMRERSSVERGVGWYRDRFGPGTPIRGESSVAYSFPWFPQVAARAAELLGRPRLIYLVRDPVERALSHHAQLAARDGRSAAEALSAPGNPYIEASRYRTALEPFLGRFGGDRLLVLRQDDLLERREATMRRVFEFLGVDPEFSSPGFDQERNRTAGKGRLYRLAERARATRAGVALAAVVPPRVRASVERRLARGGGAATPPVLDPSQHRDLLDRLEPETAGIEALTGWDLRAWREWNRPLRS
jgi:hypothetical protein